MTDITRYSHIIPYLFDYPSDCYYYWLIGQLLTYCWQGGRKGRDQLLLLPQLAAIVLLPTVIDSSQLIGMCVPSLPRLWHWLLPYYYQLCVRRGWTTIGFKAVIVGIVIGPIVLLTQFEPQFVGPIIVDTCDYCWYCGVFVHLVIVFIIETYYWMFCWLCCTDIEFDTLFPIIEFWPHIYPIVPIWDDSWILTLLLLLFRTPPSPDRWCYCCWTPLLFPIYYLPVGHPFPITFPLLTDIWRDLLIPIGGSGGGYAWCCCWRLQYYCHSVVVWRLTVIVLLISSHLLLFIGRTPPGPVPVPICALPHYSRVAGITPHLTSHYYWYWLWSLGWTVVWLLVYIDWPALPHTTRLKTDPVLFPGPVSQWPPTPQPLTVLYLFVVVYCCGRGETWQLTTVFGVIPQDIVYW